MDEGKVNKVRIAEMKSALEHNKSMVERHTEREDCWGIYDSGLTSFENIFFQTLPDSYRKSPAGRSPNLFRDYIVGELSSSKEKQHDLTAVEFGGPGSKLFRGFNPNFFKRTAGVCLKDMRVEAEKEIDQQNNHFVIEGNLLGLIRQEDDNLIAMVTEKLETNKTDLIISKIEGAHEYINKDGAILDRLIRSWYDMLNENGLIFVQFEYFYAYPVKLPTPAGELVKKWVTEIKSKFPSIDIDIANHSVMRLKKGHGSPAHLPPATQLFK